MEEKEKNHKLTEREKKEMILEALLTGKFQGIPLDNEMREWFRNWPESQEKEEILARKFDELFEGETTIDILTLDKLKTLKQQLGMEIPMYEVRDGKIDILRYKKRNLTQGKRRYNKTLRIAAILIPAAVLAGLIWFLTGPGFQSGTIDDNILAKEITITSSPGSNADKQIADGQLVVVAEHSTIMLPDNTTIRLGKESQIRHSGNFEGERQVELTGDAHFNVSKAQGAGNNFTVHTEHFRIVVLGTQFDVNTTENTQTTIDLYHGSIEMQTADGKYLMTPRDHLEYNYTTHEVILSRIPVTQLVYDEMPGFDFHDTPLTTIFRKLEDDFGIPITLHGNISDAIIDVTGDFTTVQSLDELMRILQKLSGRFTYEITDDEIIVKINTQ